MRICQPCMSLVNALPQRTTLHTVRCDYQATILEALFFDRNDVPCDNSYLEKNCNCKWRNCPGEVQRELSSSVPEIRPAI